ncbi:MAG: hypothetical protein IK080_09840 [Clostridia bacterium]|nr:hypothetical protein [Clostridia bacterium]
MKKILALILAGVMLFAFAACGGNDEKNQTEAPEVTTEAPVEETTAAPVDETTAAPVEETTAAPEGETTAAAADATTVAGETTTAKPEETTKAAGLNSTDPAEVLAYYNAALAKSKNTKCNQKMTLVEGSLTGDGAVGAIVRVLEPAAVKALAKNSNERDTLPGQPDKYPLTPADVKSAKATSANGVTTIEIQLKDQVDGPDGDGDNGGPVARGVGTLGSIENALNEMGAELTSGRETVKLTYNNAYIKVKVDEKTGKITSGTWHQMTNIFIGEAKAKLGITATLKNFKGQVEFVVTM